MKQLFCITLALALILLLTALPAMAENAVPPKPLPAESEESFLGHWEPSGTFARGVMLDPEAFAVDLQLDISAGSIVLSTNGYTFKSATEFMEDGTLKVTDQGGPSLIFNVNDDGSICCLQSVNGDSIVLYFSRTGEPEA